MFYRGGDVSNRSIEDQRSFRAGLLQELKEYFNPREKGFCAITLYCAPGTCNGNNLIYLVILKRTIAEVIHKTIYGKQKQENNDSNNNKATNQNEFFGRRTIAAEVGDETRCDGPKKERNSIDIIFYKLLDELLHYTNMQAHHIVSVQDMINIRGTERHMGNMVRNKENGILVCMGLHKIITEIRKNYPNRIGDFQRHLAKELYVRLSYVIKNAENLTFDNLCTLLGIGQDQMTDDLNEIKKGFEQYKDILKQMVDKLKKFAKKQDQYLNEEDNFVHKWGCYLRKKSLISPDYYNLVVSGNWEKLITST